MLLRFGKVTIDDALGPGEDATATLFDPVPLLVSGMLRLPAAPQWAFGYALVTRQQYSATFTNAVDTPRDTINIGGVSSRSSRKSLPSPILPRAPMSSGRWGRRRGVSMRRWRWASPPLWRGVAKALLSAFLPNHPGRQRHRAHWRQSDQRCRFLPVFLSHALRGRLGAQCYPQGRGDTHDTESQDGQQWLLPGPGGRQQSSGPQQRHQRGQPESLWQRFSRRPVLPIARP